MCFVVNKNVFCCKQKGVLFEFSDLLVLSPGILSFCLRRFCHTCQGRSHGRGQGGNGGSDQFCNSSKTEKKLGGEA
jgi:hypothetical protein